MRQARPLPIALITLVLVTVAAVAVAVIGGLGIPADNARGSACTVAPTDLVSWWPGDGNAGDIVGGNTGTPKNGATFGSGQVLSAFSFDGVDDFVEVADDPSLDITQAITIDAWINMTTLLTSSPGIVGKWDAATNQRSFLLQVNKGTALAPDGTIGFFVTPNGSAQTFVVSSTPLAVGTWHHVAGVYDGSRILLYVDGQLAASTAYGANIFSGSAPVTIGAFNIPSRFLHGLVDEVEIFDRALSGGEIAAIFNAGTGGKCKVQVGIDIKPGSDPNCFNNNGHGVIPVAFLGSATFDATQIDPATAQMNDLAVKVRGKSNKLLAHIEDVNNDGFQDLVVQIEDVDGVFSSGSGTATLTATLFSGVTIYGTDSICIVPS